MTTCAAEGCERPVSRRALCAAHYSQQWRAEQRAKNPLPTTDERFWAKVDKGDGSGCWLWTAATQSNGYGVIKIGGRQGKTVRAHRYAYEQANGPVPDGLELDHLCRVRNCVRPEHLEAVTGAVNNARGTSPTAENLRKTHCPKGHSYDEANTIMERGHRVCRTCRRDYQREWERRGSRQT